MDEPSLRAWSFCDRRCPRCPLAAECALHRRSAENESDDPNAILRILSEAFGEEGVEVLDVALAEAAQRYLDATEDACELARRDDRELVDEARLSALILTGRVAQLKLEDSELRLLLIDRLEQHATALVLALCARAKSARLFAHRRAREEFRRLLDAHLARIRDDDREVLDRMIESGRAPSPFCVIARPPLQAA
jgi:hypothetical protein